MKKITLIHKFSLVCFIVLMVFCIILGSIITNALEQDMLIRTQNLTASVVTSEIVSEFTSETLTPPRNRTEYDVLTKKIEHLTFVPGILRMKIWNKKEIVIWSDVWEIVGKQFPGNEDLTKAFQGEIAVEISSLDKEENETEKHFEGLMELYVPIRFGSTDDIEYVLEIYQDINPLYRAIRMQKLNVWITSILGFSILYLLLFGIIWRASKLIEKQTEEIVKTEVIRESEARLSKIFNATPDTILIVHLDDGLIIYSNPAINRMLVYKPEEILGKTIGELDLFVNLEERDNLIERVTKENQVIGFETELRTQDKRTIHGYISASVIQMEDGACIVVLVRDISKRKQNEQELKEKTKELEKLTNELRELSRHLSMQEEESRKKFARVLHEQVGQDLATMKLSLMRILENSPLDQNKTRTTMEDAVILLQDAMKSTRDLTADLYPTILDDLGFIPAVKWYTEKILKPSGIAVSVSIGDEAKYLPDNFKLPLFRVIQESFQNIIKHASATEVNVELAERDGILKLTIRDNGSGMDRVNAGRQTETGIGLKLMNERALAIGGRFIMISEPGKGTEVIIEVQQTPGNPEKEKPWKRQQF